MRLQTLYKLSDTDVAAWMMAACKLKVTVSTMRKIMDHSGENATTLSPAENSSSRDTSASIYDVTRAMLSTPDGRESPSEQTFYFLRRLYDTLGVNPMREICFAMCAREFYALETEQIAQIFFFEGSEKDPLAPEYMEDSEERNIRQSYTRHFTRLERIWQAIRCYACEVRLGTHPCSFQSAAHGDSENVRVCAMCV